MLITDALADRNVFGALPAFRDLGPWAPWITFLRAVYGLPFETPAELATFRAHTGRTAPRSGGYSEAIAVVGRQAGKSQVAATLAVFEAIKASRAEARGTWAVLVAQDQRSALRTLFGYCVEPFGLPMLAAAVVGRTADTLALESGVSLAAYPCRPASVRRLRARVVIVDEVAFFISSDGRPTDTEMLRALRPTLATTGGKLIVLSSPYAQSGALYELHRRHYGRDDSTTLVWQASAPAMNPTLPADYLERMEADDPEAFRSEVLGEFRAGISTFLDADQVGQCVVSGRRELMPVNGVRYTAHVDPAGGGKDAFAVAVGHQDGNRVIVDCVRAWYSKNPDGTVDECVDLVRRYGVTKVKGDRYSAEWCREAFRKRGVSYEWSDLDRSALYLELLPMINSGAVELLDDEALLRELRGLERRRGSSGRDRVDHRSGAHDDRATCIAGVVASFGRFRPTWRVADPDDGAAPGEPKLVNVRRLDLFRRGGPPFS